jgi:transmembrane sensor
LPGSSAMTEPTQTQREALAQIAPRWDAERTERTLAAARVKRMRLTQRRRLLAGTATLLALIGVGLAAQRVFWQPLGGLAGLAGAARTPEFPRDTLFEDGSRVALLDADAKVVVEEVSETRVTVRLLSGRVRVEVTPRPERRFRVHSGELMVEVLGTAFELQRQAARTRVAVLHGRVAVRWHAGESQLTAGEAGWFPKAGATDSSDSAGVEHAQRASEPRVAAQPAPRKASPERGGATPATTRTDAVHAAAWRASAEQGDFHRAYELLAQAPEPVGEDVKELMLAADAARLSGHAAQALPFLQRVIERHQDDPRAPLAAFTLGGVLMNQLGQPREAELAYGRARTLAISPSLAQDALARQVEAAHRAGETARARALALQYLELYPDGRRVRAVRRFGGL